MRYIIADIILEASYIIQAKDECFDDYLEIKESCSWFNRLRIKFADKLYGWGVYLYSD